MLFYLNLAKFALFALALSYVAYLYHKVGALQEENSTIIQINKETQATLLAIKDDYAKTVSTLKRTAENDRALFAKMKSQQEALKGLQDAPTAEVLKKAVTMTNKKD